MGNISVHPSSRRLTNAAKIIVPIIAIINAFVVADDLDGANYIFEMQKLYHEYLQDHLKPTIKHSNEKKLAFSGLNSQILIDTADNRNIGRKFTIQLAHLSECSRFTQPLPEIM